MVFDDDGNVSPARIAVRIVDKLAGRKFLECDEILDNMRRFLWLKRFSGASDEMVLEHLKDASIIAEIAQEIMPFSILDAEEIIMETRLALWMQNYARVPGSVFGRQYLASTGDHLSEVKPVDLN
ncbi:MAG: hypothetical protein CMN55_16410 [Sneathiella sp.]|jgi:hypothetical protein|uniref:hypothetical protein n=1 Tax=Sneathiella sp. TaxID=1964365 RepID=UPI000C67CB04|nr:hypothetical protein [Sneathiella sp.]MAL80661.1 hypothetical protein [Sneathiella sp.]|tara:strand:+ start:7657 stop:8031 length:375 start_codon:yes stop_codon:yes gene_type:complete